MVLAGVLVGWAAWLSGVRPPLYGRGLAPAAPRSVSIILTADNGATVGTSEGGALQALLTSATTNPYDSERLLCEEVLHGSLFGAPVTTGIGHDRAVIAEPPPDVPRRHQGHHMFLGTGGFSPARGGIVKSANGYM